MNRKDQKKIEKGGAERDEKIMLSSIQVKHPTELVMELKPPFTSALCSEQVWPVSISSVSHTSVQTTTLTELTVVSMVARQTGTSSGDWMTVLSC